MLLFGLDDVEEHVPQLVEALQHESADLVPGQLRAEGSLEFC